MADETIRRFWIDRVPVWPEDRQGFTFLLNAVDVIGKALCGSVWTGREPITPFKPIGLVTEKSGMQVRTSIEKASLSQQIQAYSALREVEPELPVLSLSVLQGKAPVPLTPDQWERALDRTAIRDARNDAAFHRFVCVMKLLSNALAEGALQAVVRKIEGGVYEPLPPYLWNTEHYAARFAFGQIDLKNPFGEGVCDTLFPTGQIHQRSRYKSACDFRFIMVHRDGLGKLVQLIETPGPSDPAPIDAAARLDTAALGAGAATAIASEVPRSKKYPEEKLDKWLIQTYEGKGQPSQDTACTEAKVALPGVTRDQVRSAMERVAGMLGWSMKPGPRGERRRQA